MSHDPHTGPEDAVLHDGCEECARRAAKPLDGLCHLDLDTYSRMRARMIAVEYGTGDESYRSDNEAALGHALYLISVLEDRNGPIYARED
jgi:hypothetical protein